jgi:hypothetical protein
MATNSITSATALQDLAKTITTRFDTDGDGRLSTDEFSGFLSSFLGSLNSNPLTAAASSSTSSSTSSATRDKVGTMAGFDATKLANLSHTSTKYQIGRVLQYYPNTPAGLKDALPELQQLVPGVKITGSNGDKLDFGEYVDPKGFRIGVIDVIQAAGAGGVAWQWNPVDA